MIHSTMKPRSVAWRRAVDRLVKVIASLSAMVGLVALAWILCVVIARGASTLTPSIYLELPERPGVAGDAGLRVRVTWPFFTELPRPPGVPGGGLANAVIGTLIMTGLGALIGVPLGLLTGVYLAEFGKASLLAQPVRFAANILMGTPSILIGVFVYAMLVLTTRSFSGFAGAVALAIIILPVVIRTTEDMLNLVPDSLRESALALGAPRWKVTLGIVFRAAKSGMLTGILLAVARVSGESAPLLFTAFNSTQWVESLKQPTANLTVSIFQYAMTPYDDWQRLAWGASLLITVGVLSLMLLARLLLRGRQQPW